MKLGCVIAEKYLLDRVIGQGGMGLVVRATHVHLQQPVAIKFLHPAGAQDAETVQRFLREARAAVRLRGEHVARVLDVGALDTGTPYMVLEYLDGTDLEDFPRARLTIGALVDLMLQACEALAEAHALGIVHRDIKPANFFVTTDPGGTLFLKLIDFGISKIHGATGNLTKSQAVLGTPVYMSPEQVRAAHMADPRSDLWSLGIVLYELIEGVLPFDGDGMAGTLLQIVNDPPPKLTARMPHGLDAVIYRCLEKDPERRFQTTAQLAAALAPYAGSPAQAAITLERTRALAVGTGRAATGPDDSEASALRRMRRTTRGGRVSRLLTVAAAIVFGGGAVGLAMPRSNNAAAQVGEPAVDWFAPAPAPAPRPDLASAPLPALFGTAAAARELACPAPRSPAPANEVPSGAGAPTVPATAASPTTEPPLAVESRAEPPASASPTEPRRVEHADDSATGATSDAPVRRTRPRRKSHREPAQSNIRREGPSSPPPVPRFSRGDS